MIFQPFRGNPNYDTVANLPYDSKCLAQLTQGQEEINIKSIARCRMETMYDTVCMNNKVGSSNMMYYDLISLSILYYTTLLVLVMIPIKLTPQLSATI